MARPAKAVGFMHMVCTKGWVLEHIERYGAADVLGAEWKDRDAEAMEAVRASPLEFFPPAGCDNVTPEGKCGGHRH